MKSLLSTEKLGNRMNTAKEPISEQKESANGLPEKAFERAKPLEEKS